MVRFSFARSTTAFLTLFVFLTTLAAPRPASAQEPEYKTVVAEGVAGATDNLRAHDDALQDAYRRAVEQAAGTLVTSQTETENFELKRDKVLTQSAGYVRAVEVLSEKEEFGLLRVRIKCEVALGPLKDDLVAMKILQAEAGLPRLLVLGEESIDGEPSYERLVATELEGFLAESGFTIIAGDFFEERKQRDAALSEKVYSDYKMAVSLAERQNAELVVTYSATADSAGRDGNWHLYRPQMTLRVVDVSTAKLIASMNFSLRGPVGNTSKQQAARKALQDLGYEHAPEVRDQIIKALQSVGEKSNYVEFVLADVDFVTASEISQKIAEMRGVSVVGQMEFTGSVAVMRLEGSLGGQALAQRLASEIQGVEVIEVNANTVKARAERSRRR